MPKEKSKLKTAEVAVSLEHLESPFPPPLPKGEALAVGNWLFYWGGRC